MADVRAGAKLVTTPPWILSLPVKAATKIGNSFFHNTTGAVLSRNTTKTSLTIKGKRMTKTADVPKWAVATIEMACARWHVGKTFSFVDSPVVCC